MNKPLFGFYSHSTKTFNTTREVNEYDFISKRYNCFIISPNIHLFFKKTSIYNQYIQLIDIVDFIVVSSFNGTIGRGSFYEVNQALGRNIPVFELYSVGRGFKTRKVVGVKVLPANNLTSYAKLETVPLKNNLY